MPSLRFEGLRRLAIDDHPSRAMLVKPSGKCIAKKVNGKYLRNSCLGKCPQRE